MRSKLFVPGTRPEWFDKALAGAADAVSFDLEDSVAPERKAEARANVAALLRSGSARPSGKLLVVRVNAVADENFERDMAAVALPGVALINLPKAGSAEEVRLACGALERAEAANGVKHPIGLLLTVETPLALRHAAELGAAHPRVAALQLGLGDLFEPLGIARDDAANVHAAMFALRLAAADAGVAACDGAHPGIGDSAGFVTEARMARRLGYIGKSCIHPSQVALANETFSASAADVAAAQRVVDAAREAALQGRAAFAVDGRMVDAPYLQRALAILDSVVDGVIDRVVHTNHASQ